LYQPVQCTKVLYCDIIVSMKKSDLYWLAGLLEGEGSFTKGNPSSPNQPRISLQMTDEDIVARAAELLGRKPYSHTDRRQKMMGWKQTYQVSLRGTKALEIMRTIRPLMGIRRRAQIDSAIASYSPDYGLIITQKQVRDIRRLKGKMMAVDVAKKFAISKWYVYKIWQNKNRC